MAKFQRLRYLRYRHLDGLDRGPSSRRRLRHLQGWLDRIVDNSPAEGGLSGTIARVPVAADHMIDRFTARAHSVHDGQALVMRGTTAPGGMILPNHAQGVLTATDNFADGETVTIDDIVYTFESDDLGSRHTVPHLVKVAGTLADSLANLVVAIEGDPSGNAKASATQTLDSLPANGETFAVGTVTYTFRSSESDVSNTSGTTIDVHIKTSIAEQLEALINAINGDGTYGGHPVIESERPDDTSIVFTSTVYGPAGNLTVSDAGGNFTEANLSGGTETHSDATEAHPLVEVERSTGTALTAQARDETVAGADIATAETGANASWGGAMMTGGAAPAYYARAIDDDTFELYNSADNARSGAAGQIRLTSNGASLTFEQSPTDDYIIALMRGGVRSDRIEAVTHLSTL